MYFVPYILFRLFCLSFVLSLFFVMYLYCFRSFVRYSFSFLRYVGLYLFRCVFLNVFSVLVLSFFSSFVMCLFVSFVR